MIYWTFHLKPWIKDSYSGSGKNSINVQKRRCERLSKLGVCDYVLLSLFFKHRRSLRILFAFYVCYQIEKYSNTAKMPEAYQFSIILHFVYIIIYTYRYVRRVNIFMFTYTHHTLLLCMMVKIKIFCIHVVESNSFDTHHIEATDSFNETLKWGSKCLQIHFSRKIQNLLSLWMVVSCDSILSLIRAQNVYKMNGEGWCHSMEIPLLRAKNLLKTFRPNRLFNENSLPVTIWKHSILHQLSAFSLHFVHYVILVPLSMSFYLFFISLICIFQLCFCCRRRCCCWLFFYSCCRCCRGCFIL